MAAMAATCTLSSSTSTATAPALSARHVHGLKAATSFSKPQSLGVLPCLSVQGKGALGARCDYLGSPTNLVMIASTTAMLFAGRFGLAPSANRKASAGLKLEDRDSGLQTGDPAGFTGTDTLACGAVGHVIGVGVVLGLRYLGAI